ncbi:alkaline phosphatase family protein [Planomonospora parontospora subsp. parontospora]|uniref:Alkaline phosphatase family protein n=2 Tax=Planomonospora parontospora TaxID=58119 RepID=A0AA37BFI7_9ACTN|nr:nucleotide pyrophosphatase/phosphodiesterase family protein [Planomonospora parontospora]GGK63931.1 alkaline phosphatase family protein [Planomonospora parontospora]GII08150.1 alkaline phosphatase family protein [Planomonospora parontospora subsp. parontospora]
MSPLVPAYGEASLADLSSSLLAVLGMDGANPLGLAPADRVLLFLVDGLGAELLRAHPEAAPFLSSRAGRTLTAGFPATTATSLGTLGTGLPPGEHGMLGYQLAVPGAGYLFNCLRWTAFGPLIAPEEWQPTATVFERAAAAGISTSYVAPAQFEGTGFNQAVYRGVRFVGADAVDDRVEGVRRALAEPRAHVTVYYGDLDAAGHMRGWGSPEWLDQLARVDRMAERLAETLPPGSAMYVTADHGMVNATDRIDADAVPALREGVALLGGEARARHVYAAPGAAGAVLESWRGVLGEAAWVASREEAVESGWFGPRVRPEWLPRIGDVVAVPRAGTVVVASAAEPLESSFTGYHGSLTPAEQYVPLLEVSTR